MRPAITNGIFIVLALTGLFFPAILMAQQSDSIKGKNIYRPQKQAEQDTLVEPVNQPMLVDDSLAAITFFQDSIRLRELFVRDSLIRMQRIHDSVNILKTTIRPVLEACMKAFRDEIIISPGEIRFMGDTALLGYNYELLPLGVRDPYTPWKGHVDLSSHTFSFAMDHKSGQVISLTMPIMKASFLYPADRILIIRRSPIVQKNNYGNYYREPVDSVFTDRQGRILKIKSYQLFYSLMNGNSKGNLLFTNRTQVKQFVFDNAGQPMQLQIVRFCERWKVYENNKVCSILTYFFSNQGNDVLLTRRNDPANNYSDGTFTFAFDNNKNLKSISFVNVANTEGWTRKIELNKDGNVNCYIDMKNELIFQSLCMIYHKEPGAKFPVETITTTFEKDGISYFQKNNTTGKIRTRDKMTLEWTPWQ